MIEAEVKRYKDKLRNLTIILILGSLLSVIITAYGVEQNLWYIGLPAVMYLCCLFVLALVDELRNDIIKRLMPKTGFEIVRATAYDKWFTVRVLSFELKRQFSLEFKTEPALENIKEEAKLKVQEVLGEQRKNLSFSDKFLGVVFE